MIHVENLSKEFKKCDRRKGLGGAFKDLFHRDYKIFKAVENVSVNDGFTMLIDIYNQDQKGNERLNELKKIVNIEPLLTMPVRKLSLGQRTLCEVVASVLHSPKILFLDEPTIGLDLFSKDQALLLTLLFSCMEQKIILH